MGGQFHSLHSKLDHSLTHLRRLGLSLLSLGLQSFRGPTLQGWLFAWRLARPSAIRRLQGRRQSEQRRIPLQNHHAATGGSMTFELVASTTTATTVAPSVKLRTSLAD